MNTIDYRKTKAGWYEIPRFDGLSTNDIIIEMSKKDSNIICTLDESVVKNPLIGSEKQIAWATDIRASLVPQLLEMAQKITKKRDELRDQHLLTSDLEVRAVCVITVISNIITALSASTWIDIKQSLDCYVRAREPLGNYVNYLASKVYQPMKV